MKAKKPRPLCACNCGREVVRPIYKYFSLKCQQEAQYHSFIEKWKRGEDTGVRTLGILSNYIRRYILEKYHSSCVLCGWNEISPYTGNCPIHVDHIDGNHENNAEDNLRCLCPNCHSLTSSYGGCNKGKGRPDRRLRYRPVSELRDAA